MKLLLTLLTISAMSIGSVAADGLSTLNVKDWLSYHTISKGKYHTLGIQQDGTLDLFIMKRDERLNIKWPIDLCIRVERRDKKSGSKWVSKQVTKDGFQSPPKASVDPKELILEGMVTGEVKFKVHFEFLKEGVEMKAEFVGKPKDADTADYRLILKSTTGDMYTISNDDLLDEKKVKSKTRGSELLITTRKNKAERVRFYEKIDKDKFEQEGITQLVLKSKRLGRRNLVWSLADSKKGQFIIDPKDKAMSPIKGLSVTTVLVDESGKRLGDGVILEYK